MLKNRYDDFGDHKVMIDKFLRIHEQTFDSFFREVERIVSVQPTTEIEAFNQLQKLAQSITLWMQYTTFEILSLDRCLFGDGVAIIGTAVVDMKLTRNLDLVKQLIQCGCKPVDLRFTSPDLTAYEFLFREVLEDASEASA